MPPSYCIADNVQDIVDKFYVQDIVDFSRICIKTSSLANKQKTISFE